MKIGSVSPLFVTKLLPWRDVEPGTALLVGRGGTDTTTLLRRLLQNGYHVAATPLDPLLETPVVSRGNHHLGKDLQLALHRIRLPGRTSLRIRAQRHDRGQRGQCPRVRSQRSPQQRSTHRGGRAELVFDERPLLVGQVASIPSLLHPTRSLSARSNHPESNQSLKGSPRQLRAPARSGVTAMVSGHERVEFRRHLKNLPINRTLYDSIQAFPSGGPAAIGTHRTPWSVRAPARFLLARPA
jgi:hypothetical protein